MLAWSALTIILQRFSGSQFSYLNNYRRIPLRFETDEVEQLKNLFSKVLVLKMLVPILYNILLDIWFRIFSIILI